jgi:hypothetical protein
VIYDYGNINITILSAGALGMGIKKLSIFKLKMVFQQMPIGFDFIYSLSFTNR